MFKALFSLIINLVASVIQIVCLPLNLAVSSALPDLTEKISFVTTQFSTIFNNINWALGLIPPILIETILFIITIEIAKHTIYLSTHTLLKVWNIVQKIKFW